MSNYYFVNEFQFEMFWADLPVAYVNLEQQMRVIYNSLNWFLLITFADLRFYVFEYFILSHLWILSTFYNSSAFHENVRGTWYVHIFVDRYEWDKTKDQSISLPVCQMVLVE